MFLRVSGVALMALVSVIAACSQSDSVTANPALAIARLDEVPSDGAVYSTTHGLYLVDAGNEGLIALSQRDPFRGCTVHYLEESDTFAGFTLEPGARFVDPCHGGQYDIAGRVLTGPSDANLQRVPIEVVGDVVYVDPNPAREA